MMRIVQVRNSSSQSLDTGGRSVFSSGHGNINGLRSFEATFDIIVDFRCTLTQVCPFLRLLQEAMLVGSLRAPNYTGGGTSRVEASVWFVALVGIAELFVDFGVCF